MFSSLKVLPRLSVTVHSLWKQILGQLGKDGQRLINEVVEPCTNGADARPTCAVNLSRPPPARRIANAFRTTPVRCDCGNQMGGSKREHRDDAREPGASKPQTTAIAWILIVWTPGRLGGVRRGHEGLAFFEGHDVRTMMMMVI